MRRGDWSLVAGCILFLAGCGYAPTGQGPGPQAASPARTDSPAPTPSPQAVPDLSQLTASNCSGSGPSTMPRSLGGYYTIRVPSSWIESGKPPGNETLLLELVAPQIYGFAPTKLQFHSDLGPVHTVYGSKATPHSIAQQHAGSVASDTALPHAVAGLVGDCTFGGEPAAVFGYSDGTYSGYRLYVVRKDFLYEVFLFGSGGVSRQAIQDAVGMIGSVIWAP
jgi:hypothetical protein